MGRRKRMEERRGEIKEDSRKGEKLRRKESQRREKRKGREILE